MSNWRVEATLSSPVVGELPYLCGLLEYEMAQRTGKAQKIQRGQAAPMPGEVHVPCLRGSIGGVNSIPRCSAPIARVLDDRHEYFAKRLCTENAHLLRTDEQKVVATGNSTYKSYRLPIRAMKIPKVCWFVGGSKRRTLLSLLKSVHSLGKKRSQGFGRVHSWEAYEVEHDWSWFAPTGDGTLLMRALPLCDELPRDLIGYKRHFGACVPPMWHPDRFMEVVVPA